MRESPQQLKRFAAVGGNCAATVLFACVAAVLFPAPAHACIGCAGMYSDISVMAEVTYLVAAIHATLMDTMQAAATSADQGIVSAALFLPLGIGFSYGALHALGPGHGKVVVAGYFAGTPSPAREAVRMAGEIAVLHVGSAFLLAVAAALLLNGALVVSDPAFTWVRLISYGLIIVAGGLMLYRAAAMALRPRGIRLPLPALLDTGACACGHHDDAHGDHAHDHHHEHEPRGRAALSFAVGAVPCTGALIAVMFALASGAWVLGLMTVAAISLGMGATLAGVGLFTIWTRGRFALSGNGALRGLEVFGALAVLAAGGLLFYGTAATL